MSIAWVFFGVPFAGFGTIVALILALIGVVTFMLSVLAEYMGLIYEEVKNRPNFVVKKTSGIN
jgi:dolichol-phosphate mannosyltransferase